MEEVGQNDAVFYVTSEDWLTLSIGKGPWELKWSMDAAIDVHLDYCRHTGGLLKFKECQGMPLQQSSN